MTHHVPHQQQPSPLTAFGGVAAAAAASSGSPFEDGSMLIGMGLPFYNRIIDEGKGRLGAIETSELRKRFAVTHEYVARKLRLLAFPFRHKFATRASTAGLLGGGGGGGSAAGGDDFESGGAVAGDAFVAGGLGPTSDVGAPDLYLPLMGVITYVVFCAFGRGLTATATSLSPEELTGTVTASVVTLLVETLIVKLWRMAASLPPLSFFDVIALFGYLFVSVCYALTARALFDAWLPAAAWVGTLYVLAALIFFTFRAFGDAFAKDGAVPARAQPILFAATALQAPLFLWFVRRAY